MVIGQGYSGGHDQFFIASDLSPSENAGVHCRHLNNNQPIAFLMQPTVEGAVLHDRLRNTVTTAPQNNGPSMRQFALSAHEIQDRPERYNEGRADGHGSSSVFKPIHGASDFLRAGSSAIRTGERLTFEKAGGILTAPHKARGVGTKKKAVVDALK